MFETAAALNIENIKAALRQVAPAETLVDLGSDDGALTLEFAEAAGATRVVGVEVVAERAELARARGIEVVVASLNDPVPIDAETADVVVSNQVIEHLFDTDRFVDEAYRILRPGGTAIVSTENLASWHNIGPLFFGWQPFSLTNVSSRSGGLGNPIAVHRGATFAKPWEHLRVFAYRALRELFELHGFTVEDVLGAGYYPLPAPVGRRLPRHAAFMTIVARKT
jgi:SAM-dependent methyltransferase